MGKRNKGTTKAQRNGASMAQRARMQVAEDAAVRGKAIMDALNGMDCASAHRLLMVTIAAMEQQMDELGVDIIATQRVSGGEFVPCRRCAYNEVAYEDECGKVGRCTQLRRKDGDVLSCRTDGCSWGVTR